MQKPYPLVGRADWFERRVLRAQVTLQNLPVLAHEVVGLRWRKKVRVALADQRIAAITQQRFTGAVQQHIAQAARVFEENHQRRVFHDGLGQRLGVQQGLLRALALGDIAQKSHHVPRFDRMELGTDLHVKHPAVLGTVPGLKTVRTRVDDLLDLGKTHGRGLVGLKLADAHGQQLGHAVAVHARIGLIDFQQAPLQI